MRGFLPPSSVGHAPDPTMWLIRLQLVRHKGATSVPLHGLAGYTLPDTAVGRSEQIHHDLLAPSPPSDTSVDDLSHNE